MEAEARLCVQELAAGLITNIGHGRPIKTVRQPQALITGRALYGAREIRPPHLKGTFSLPLLRRLPRRPPCLGGRFAWTEAPAQAGCAHAGEATWTLADGRRTSSGAGKQLGTCIVLGGGQFWGAHQRVEFDCSVGSNTLAAAPQPALCIPAGMLPLVSKRRS